MPNPVSLNINNLLGGNGLPTSIVGNVNLGSLTSGTKVAFAPSGTVGTLTLNQILGTSALTGLGFGDQIILNGVIPVLAGNTLTTSTGTLSLGSAPPNTGYVITSNANGASVITLTPNTLDVYRFFDTVNGTQFYTASVGERNQVLATRPDLKPEGPNGVGLESIDPASNDPNAVPVYRFFDTKLGTHFFTASATERDTVAATRPDLIYENGNVFYEHATAQAGDAAVYRFFDSVHGTHFYTDSATEKATIMQTRPDLISEGIGFYEPPRHPAS